MGCRDGIREVQPDIALVTTISVQYLGEIKVSLDTGILGTAQAEDTKFLPLSSSKRTV